MSDDIQREDAGKFKKGVSGNPKGRPKAGLTLQHICKEHAETAIQILLGIMTDEKAKSGDRIRAAEIILERGYGKPMQAVELGGAGGGPVQVNVNVITKHT